MSESDKKGLITMKTGAIAVVLILVVGAMIYFISTNEAGEGEEGGAGPDEVPFQPVMLSNSQVTNIPQANNEPSIAVNPTDPLNIVAASNDYGSPRGDAWCGFYATFDGGETWERGLVPGADGQRGETLWKFAGGGDPVLAFGPNGDCYLAGIVFQRDNSLLNLVKPGTGIFVARSTDGGRTFPQVSIVIQSISLYTTFHDKEWIAVDPTTGDVHITWTAFNLYGVAASIVHSVSTDNGNSWSLPQLLSDLTEGERQTQGSQVEVTNDGVVHVSWIDYDRGSLRYTRSSNGGDSFGDVRTIASVTPMDYYLPNGDYRTPTMCDMAVDTSGGEHEGSIYICWPDQSSGNADILMVYSNDGGSTFSTAMRVNNDTTENDQWFPAICVGIDGSVQLVFYDRRDDPENNLMSVYYAVTYDQGETFDNYMYIDEEVVNFEGDNTRGPFIGDYLGIASTHNRTYAVWCDAREGTPETVRSDIWCGIVQYLPDEEVDE